MSDWANGPGMYEEGPSETAGSSRPRGRREFEGRPAGPGVDAERSPEERKRVAKAQARNGRPEPLIELWRWLMRDACDGRWATEMIQPQIFNKHVKDLRDRGLTDDLIRGLFLTFAGQVKDGRIDVNHKEPWFVFVKRWPRLGKGGSVSSNAEARQSWTREDWLA